MQLAQAADLLLADLDRVLAALKRRAFEHKQRPRIGRSHGIHAEPTTFGLKLAGHYAEFARDRARLAVARVEIATCAISGAGRHLRHRRSPGGGLRRREAGPGGRAGLHPGDPARPPRRVFLHPGVIASVMERLATEIRHLQRSEVREAEESFHPGQKGSSAMPHKRNPVLSENLTGLARLVRAAVVPALENVTLWHERDISHSSVERVIAPDATVALDFALVRLADLIERLVISRADARQPQGLGGVVHSARPWDAARRGVSHLTWLQVFETPRRQLDCF